MVRSLIKYKYSILSGIIIIVALVASYFYFGELNPVIAAVGGLLFSIPIRFFWLSYTSPILKIKERVERRIFHLGERKWEYTVNRIIVQNTGRSAARSCKGYVVTEEGKERVCWSVPKERPNATINTNDEERLDFCAFYESGPTHHGPIVVGKEQEKVPIIIAPTEEGWPQNPSDCRRLDRLEKCKVFITADNAVPVDASIRFITEEKSIKINAN
jgi:hypothetical protein